MRNILRLWFFILIIIGFTHSLAAATLPDEEVEVIARIHSQGDVLSIVRSHENDVIPSLLERDDLKKIVNSLLPGDEAIIRGRITYEFNRLEGQSSYRPVFVITSIKPVSLKKLGKIQFDQNMMEPNLSRGHLPIEYFHYSLLNIPVTPEVATSITMTASLLLMNSLTSAPSQPHTVQQLNSGMMLFAGALATGVFIFEQIKGKKNKGKSHD